MTRAFKNTPSMSPEQIVSFVSACDALEEQSVKVTPKSVREVSLFTYSEHRLNVVQLLERCTTKRYTTSCFVITTRVLRSVLGKTIVMLLLCHSSECGCFVCFA